MTLAAMWVEARDVGNQLLCFASDSRTKPGPIEGVAKVVLFGRQDIAAVWAGDYRYAALLVNFLDAFFTASDAMRRRDVDVAQALRRAAAAAQRHLQRAIAPDVKRHELNFDAQQPERTTLVVGGYSVIERAHKVLRIDWTPDDGRWRFRVASMDTTKVTFIGDHIKSAKQIARQARVHREPRGSANWQMEPLAAIHCMREDKNRGTIGGLIQLAKVYMHGSARAYGIIDDFRSGDITVRGICVDSRSAREMDASGLLVDLSHWKLAQGAYAGHRSLKAAEYAAAPPVRSEGEGPCQDHAAHHRDSVR